MLQRADSDDASINLSLGTSLYLFQDLFPTAWTNWETINIADQAIVKLMNSLTQYSYKPFAGDSNQDVIDPRTYYWLGEYLNTLVDPPSDYSLVTTWFLDINTNRETYYHNYAMPFNVNNVDGSVCANTVQGLTRAVLYNPSPSVNWFTTDVQSLYNNTVNQLAWIINTQVIEQRPDLVLLYYMGNYNFYWFVSRTVYILNSYPNALPFPVLTNAQAQLTNVMRTNATQSILNAGSCFLFRLFFSSAPDRSLFVKRK